ncbi:MAG: peptide chain release factor N(5)-glutamine methyltransferase [Burkholderiaceae bacterium]|nr:peptide chain release factor N(5)-glutamine methyltransferase [Burkholderiaceae bacterium]
MTVAEALRAAAALGLDRLDAQILLLHTLQRPAHDRAWLLAHDTDEVPQPLLPRFQADCVRRVSGEPVAYLVGEKEFHGLPLQVDARVLVPRPDTETLVDWALDVLQDVAAPRIVDLGTGSGAIALALAHARPDARITAVDASAPALNVAQANAARLGLGNVQFLQGDWLDGLDGPFELIVSNPPYIANDDPHLPALHHEPRSALAGGTDGLDDIRRIVAQAPARLAASGWLLLEHGWDQAPAVRTLLDGAGLWHPISRSDLAGIERCSGAQRAPGG